MNLIFKIKFMPECLNFLQQLINLTDISTINFTNDYKLTIQSSSTLVREFRKFKKMLALYVSIPTALKICSRKREDLVMTLPIRNNSQRNEIQGPSQSSKSSV